MNERPLKVLEFDKIITLLASHASSAPGKDLCMSLVPMDDLYEITSAQKETTEAVSLILKKGRISFGSVRNMKESILRLDVGGSLNIHELLCVASLVENAAKVKEYGRHESNDTGGETVLDNYFGQLEGCADLSGEIRRCILSEEEISSNASSALSSIRRRLSSSSDKIHTTLSSLLNGSLRNCLQDNVITMRNGRYCVPVKAEYRSSVPGMVHDQSSSGATYFIEPMSIVKLNNEIRELEAEEEKEIARILALLSALAAENSGAISRDQEILTTLDFIFAKAALSIEMKGNEPRFNDDKIIDLHKARHPLIDASKVVPIDISLGEDFDLLVITGPNTGGKTVALKTIGLLTLMGQAGLHIPALDGSRLSVFRKVFADIGDEQSIEQSLSTFSSHMKNVVACLKYADEDSLVLFDELGAGTDPTEGAALAVSILSNMHNLGIRTVATTHYSELKLYALSTDGVMNASCEFDVATLRPTYRLLIGIPGKSNAFAISQKLGLPKYIIDSAKAHIDNNDLAFEDVVADLEKSRVRLERQNEQIQKMRSESQSLSDKLKSQNEKLEQRREKIINEANEEALGILRGAKELADASIIRLQKAGASVDTVREMEKIRTELREKMNSLSSSSASKKVKKSNVLSASDLHIGDPVRVLSMNTKATVSTLPDSKGNLYVHMGILRTNVNIKDLELLPDDSTASPGVPASGGSKIKYSKSLSVSPEINLLGKTVDEAISELDKYLDDAYLARLQSVRIIHGKGTGALRKGIHNYLRTVRNVKDFHTAEHGEGDAGVTIAEFR